MASNGDDDNPRRRVAKEEDASEFDNKNSRYEQLGATSFKEEENQRPNSSRRWSVLENEFNLGSSPRKG